jgi:hypothetical protein
MNIGAQRQVGAATRRTPDPTPVHGDPREPDAAEGRTATRAAGHRAPSGTAAPSHYALSMTGDGRPVLREVSNDMSIVLGRDLAPYLPRTVFDTTQGECRREAVQQPSAVAATGRWPSLDSSCSSGLDRSGHTNSSAGGLLCTICLESIDEGDEVCPLECKVRSARLHGFSVPCPPPLAARVPLLVRAPKP